MNERDLEPSATGLLKPFSAGLRGDAIIADCDLLAATVFAGNSCTRFWPSVHYVIALLIGKRLIAGHRQVLRSSSYNRRKILIPKRNRDAAATLVVYALGCNGALA